MANPLFKQADTTQSSRAASGAGTAGDPFVFHNIILQPTASSANVLAHLVVGGSAVALGNPVPVSATQLPLPAGAATAAGLSDLLTELQLKADNNETQPVSLVNAAQQSTLINVYTQLQSLLTELQLKADLTETQPVSGTINVFAHTVNIQNTVTVTGTVDIRAGVATVAVRGRVQLGPPKSIARRAVYTSAQTDAVFISVGSGFRAVVSRMSAMVGGGVTGNTQVRLGFGAANTPTTTGVLLTHSGIAPGSGVVEGGAGILGEGEDAEAVRITCGTPSGGSLDVRATYHYEVAS